MAISVQSVSKKYRLYSLPKQRLLEALHPFRKQYHREFWALQDVSFDVPRGTTLGVIGRNGSGKSTLLQVICGILRPTGGLVETAGRISALLELGAGFNPQFTGRENAWFSGQLMGLSPAEIKARMPEIEIFADIGEFFDQPVRTYSSGMFVRLAFACAISVDPDILIIDEALAVGDARFQQRCFRKFREFQEAGKTIVFVTHDMNAICKYCDFGMLLEQGRVVAASERTNEVVNYYLDLLEGRCPKEIRSVGEPLAASEEAGSPEKQKLEGFLTHHPAADNCSSHHIYNRGEYRQGFSRAEVVDFLVVCEDRCDPSAIYCGQEVDVYIKARFHEPVERPVFGLAVKTVDGLMLFGYHTGYAGLRIEPATAGKTVIGKFSLRMNAAPGDVFLDIGVAHRAPSGQVESLDRRCAAVHLSILESSHFDGMMNFEPRVSVVSASGMPMGAIEAPEALRG